MPQVFNVRGKRVVLDREVAAYVGMSTGNLNLYVKRNIQLFDDEMWFKLSENECSRLQIVTLNKGRGSNIKYLPFVFTEEGVSMLEKVLKRSIPIEFEEEVLDAEVLPESWNEGTVVLYQPDNCPVNLEVKVTDENVWLSRNQIAILFDRDIKTISKHINNSMLEELQNIPTVANFATVQIEGDRKVTRYIEYYNLDVVLSVGYRVKSNNGIAFRRWANKVLKENVLYHNSITKRFERLENRVTKTEEQIDFFVKTSLPPKEQIFMQGQFFDAHQLFSELISGAKQRVIIIDNYVDSSVLALLSKRSKGVKGIIYTSNKCCNHEAFKLDLQKYNTQYPNAVIDVLPISGIHDRFLITDNVLYSSGGSFKDAGKKLFYFEKMGLEPEVILNIVMNG
ncbi:MAG: ORF6N domain-containing protein [Paludibacteraceae bacterium]|nr:ORF6N domain-containing protein [Paludibacteraceae bacterium]